MITTADKKKIQEISRKYQAIRVLLFGSSLDPKKQGQDIDIAVEGISPEDFYLFYGDLMLSLSKPVADRRIYKGKPAYIQALCSHNGI